MKEWKIRQEIYHRMTSNLNRGDDFANMKVVFEWDENSIVRRALEYPFIQNDYLYYPGKSFAIAIIYAQLISKIFNEDLYELLNDPQLLYGNDPYFKTYNEAKDIYDKIISQFPLIEVNQKEKFSEDMNHTMNYFKQEFMIDER